MKKTIKKMMVIAVILSSLFTGNIPVSCESTEIITDRDLTSSEISKSNEYICITKNLTEVETATEYCRKSVIFIFPSDLSEIDSLYQKLIESSVSGIYDVDNVFNVSINLVVHLEIDYINDKNQHLINSIKGDYQIFDKNEKAVYQKLEVNNTGVFYYQYLKHDILANELEWFCSTPSFWKKDKQTEVGIMGINYELDSKVYQQKKEYIVNVNLGE